MICYIKSFKDFKTIAKYDAVDYSLTDGEDGSVTIYEKNPAELTKKYAGCWLIIGDGKEEKTNLQYSYSMETDSSGGTILHISGSGLGVYEGQVASGGIEYKINAQDYVRRQYVFYISECSPQNDSLSLTLRHPIYAFDRPVKYDGSKTYGQLIENILNNGYGINCQDSEYAMTYMSVANTDSTQCSVSYDNYGYVIPCDIFEEARMNGVIIDFKNTSANRLSVSISTANYATGVVVFGDGHSQLQSESYDASYCAKATILHELPDEYYPVAQSDVFSGVNNIKYFVEIDQNIAKSKSTGKICLAARFYISWPASSLSEPDPYTNNVLDIWLGSDTSGTKLLSSTPGWERSPEAGELYTDYVELSQITNRNSLTLYCTCRADGGRGTDRNITFNDIDYSKSTDIIIGPVMENSQRASGIYYRVLDYYLKNDKTIVRDPPSSENRMYGAWHVYNCGQTESPIHVAVGAFSGNSDNHKVEFYSDKFFEYYQPMLLRLRGEVLESIITSRTISRKDNRYFYKCGNLMTTLTDHVKKLEKNS